jgi:hypothetical protein
MMYEDSKSLNIDILPLELGIWSSLLRLIYVANIHYIKR